MQRALGTVRSLPFEGDEAALVAAVRAGRADAAAAFYDRHVKAIQGIVFRLMGPDGEHADIVHDVFVRALESLTQLRDPSALRSWLFGIAVRTVAIRFQKRTRQRWLRFMAPEADHSSVLFIVGREECGDRIGASAKFGESA